MLKTITTLLIVVLAVLLVASFALWSCSKSDYSGKVESITLGYTPSEGASLVHIAQKQGFFIANGVEIIHKHYDTGKAAIEALLRGEVDIAGMSEVPFISKVFEKQEVSAYGNFDKLQYVYLIARKDRGIAAASDLKGKRIGVPRRTIADFYLGRYLELNGMRVQDLTLLETAPAEATDAITSRRLDGVVVWNPYAYQIRQRMGEKAVLLRLQSSQPAYALAVARNDWLTKHKALLIRSLKAIAQAEKFVMDHPAEARAIIQKRLSYDDEFMNSVWSENQFSLSLDQSLITAMEDEARWMIKNNLTKEKKVPDFLNYIYVDGLKAVKPEAVNIIR
jgi:NitT/TauT family transport system substrate-binding protein